MRDCIFLVADKNMEAVFSGFLLRDGFHLSLGVRRFGFDLIKDILVESGSDPGVFRRAHELLRFYRQTHRFAVVVLDGDWGGSPGVEMIQSTIQDNMIRSGWPAERLKL